MTLDGEPTVALMDGVEMSRIGYGVYQIPPRMTERMRENRAITDFSLTGDEMSEIRALDEGRSLFNWW